MSDVLNLVYYAYHIYIANVITDCNFFSCMCHDDFGYLRYDTDIVYTYVDTVNNS